MPKSKYYYASNREGESSDDTESMSCDCRYCEKSKIKQCCLIKEKYKNHFKNDNNHTNNCHECCSTTCHSNKKKEKYKEHEKINKKECQDKKVIIITIS